MTKEKYAFEGYQPKIVQNCQLIGIASNIRDTADGRMTDVIAKHQISSREPMFEVVADSLIGALGLGIRNPERLLVRIDKQDNAYVYEKFPFGYKILASTPVRPGTAVFDSQLADIITPARV